MKRFDPTWLISSVLATGNPAFAIEANGALRLLSVDPKSLDDLNSWKTWENRIAATDIESMLVKASHSVCRINFVEQEQVGSGFVVGSTTQGQALIATNLHVAKEFISYDNDLDAPKLRRFELIRDGFFTLSLDGAALEHKLGKFCYVPKKLHCALDFAVFVADMPDHGVEALPLSLSVPQGSEDVIVVGFPAVKQSALPKFEARIYGGVDNLGRKLVTPGSCALCTDQKSLAHRCATLKGSSGSPVIAIETGKVIGIHYSGTPRPEGCPCQCDFPHNSALSTLALLPFADELRALGVSFTDEPAIAPLAAASFGQAAGRVSVFNLAPDLPDFRDQYYQPPLVKLKSRSKPARWPKTCDVLMQTGPRCTGHALASLINMLEADRAGKSRRGKSRRVSATMLYEMARLHDEIPFDKTPGSTLRGVIKGFFHNGVADQALVDDDNWGLTKAIADDARRTALGAYYRLRPDLNHYHAALADTGCILVSAQLHPGWLADTLAQTGGRIRAGRGARSTAHAFVIIGYDEEGFLVLNSWGGSWGKFKKHPGVAHWSYQDWASNIIDAWVLRLAIPAPGTFGLSAVANSRLLRLEGGEAQSAILPRRSDVMGHMIAVRNGKLDGAGRYGSRLQDWHALAEMIGRKPQLYDGTLFMFHDEWRSADQIAEWTASARTVFDENRLYLVSVGWEVSLPAWLSSLLTDCKTQLAARFDARSPFYPQAFESLLAEQGGPIWRDVDRACRELRANRRIRADRETSPARGDLNEVLAPLFRHSAEIHLVGQGLGNHMLRALLGSRLGKAHHKKIKSATLLAPGFEPAQDVRWPDLTQLALHPRTSTKHLADLPKPLDWRRLCGDILTTGMFRRDHPPYTAYDVIPTPADCDSSQTLDCSAVLFNRLLGQIRGKAAIKPFYTDQFENLK